jgi:hypothetical protein
VDAEHLVHPQPPVDLLRQQKRGQWQDKRLAKWIPRPVTNILKEGVQSVRANFASINYGANARPVVNDNDQSIVTANPSPTITRRCSMRITAWTR